MPLSGEPTFGDETEPQGPVKILHITIDEVPAVAAFVASIKGLPIEEQIAQTSRFIQLSFINALSPNNISLLDGELGVKLSAEKTLSEALALQYGVCVEYHVLGKTIFDQLDIPCKFQSGRLSGEGPGHTYLDVQVNGKWQIFDPFAEVYLRDMGRPDLKLLAAGYYAASETKKVK